MNKKKILDKILDNAPIIIITGLLIFTMNKLDNANSELLELVSDYTDLTIKYSNCVNSKQFNDFDQNETIDFKTEIGE